MAQMAPLPPWFSSARSVSSVSITITEYPLCPPDPDSRRLVNVPGESRRGARLGRSDSFRNSRMSCGGTAIDELKLVLAEIRDELAVVILRDHSHLNQLATGLKSGWRRRLSRRRRSGLP
jgi:hypothetical protein